MYAFNSFSHLCGPSKAALTTGSVEGASVMNLRAIGLAGLPDAW
jgi:hypothetical protein